MGWPWLGQTVCGALPRTNTSRYAVPPRGRHPEASSIPLAGSTIPSMTPEGRDHSAGTARFWYIRSIIRAQTGAATRPPVALATIGRRLSNPTHTAATTSGV